MSDTKATKGHGHTYRRTLLPPVCAVLCGAAILSFILQIAATAHPTWASTQPPVRVTWGLASSCSQLTESEFKCFTLGEHQDDANYFGEPPRYIPEHGKEKNDALLMQFTQNLKSLYTARGLAIATTIFAITPLPFLVLGLMKDITWGAYAVPLYLLWFCLWVSTIATFNKSCNFMLTYKPVAGAFHFAAETSAQSFYEVGVFLHIGAFVAMAVSVLGYAGSYLACFHIDVYDSEGKLLTPEEVQNISKGGKGGMGKAGATRGSCASTQAILQGV